MRVSLPTLLDALAEPKAAAIDNLDRFEKIKHF